jgi:acetyl-CoA carboxylase biotin carboxyl carrier protein
MHPSPKEADMAPKIDFDEINRVIKLIEDRNLNQFELEVEGFKIKITRSAQVVYQAAPQSVPAYGPAPQNGGPFIEPAHASGGGQYVTSPIVGTFYRASSPTSPPFVEVGDVVKKKQTMCIVEAMKLMNEIESDFDGVVTEIFVENGKPVEFGQKLFAIAAEA